jgi:hypothetical protein
MVRFSQATQENLREVAFGADCAPRGRGAAAQRSESTKRLCVRRVKFIMGKF